MWTVVAALAAIHLSTWIFAGDLPLRAPGLAVLIGAGWAATLLLAVLASRRIGVLADTLHSSKEAHQATLAEMAQLQTQNAMLQIVARSVDVPLTFQALALRIARLVPCDRVGLALLTETAEEFDTFTARVHEDERRNRPRPDVVFRVEGTALGAAVRSAEPMLLSDLRAAADEFLDMNVISTAGFRSALIVPLVSNGRGIGTLNVVSRKEAAFTPEHIDALRPIAEILAVAHVAQQLHMLVGKFRTIEVMTESTLAAAAEINSALQIVIGHCDLMERGYPDPALQRDVATVAEQAHRIAALLEKMRAAAQQRLRDAASSIEDTGIPTSPEVYEQHSA